MVWEVPLPWSNKKVNWSDVQQHAEEVTWWWRHNQGTQQKYKYIHFKTNLKSHKWIEMLSSDYPSEKILECWSWNDDFILNQLGFFAHYCWTRRRKGCVTAKRLAVGDCGSHFRCEPGAVVWQSDHNCSAVGERQNKLYHKTADLNSDMIQVILVCPET